MSAWIVSKKHIDLIVAAVAEGTRDRLFKGRRINRDKLGQMLVSENVHSISYRYPDDNVFAGELPGPAEPYYLQPYTFEHPNYLPTAAELYQAVNCYDYQSCEDSRHWPRTAAKRLCDRIRSAIETVVPAAKREREDIDNNVPHAIASTWRERENSPWGFDADEISLCAAKATDEGRRMVQSAKQNPSLLPILSDWLMERGIIAEPLGNHVARLLEFARV